MKTFILLFLLMLGVASCEKDDVTETPQVYNNSEGTSINFSRIDWSTTTETYTNGSGKGNSLVGVNLKLAGFTNGDSVKVKTYGDGLIGYENIDLDKNKKFNDTVYISFSYIQTADIPEEGFTRNTSILVFKGADTLNVTLTSGELKYK